MNGGKSAREEVMERTHHYGSRQAHNLSIDLKTGAISANNLSRHVEATIQFVFSRRRLKFGNQLTRTLTGLISADACRAAIDLKGDSSLPQRLEMSPTGRKHVTRP